MTGPELFFSFMAGAILGILIWIGYNLSVIAHHVRKLP